MGFRTVENTLLYLHLMRCLLLKAIVVSIVGGKLQLKGNTKISVNTQLFYDDINCRENKEKSSSYVEE